MSYFFMPETRHLTVQKTSDDRQFFSENLRLSTGICAPLWLCQSISHILWGRRSGKFQSPELSLDQATSETLFAATKHLSIMNNRISSSVFRLIRSSCSRSLPSPLVHCNSLPLRCFSSLSSRLYASTATPSETQSQFCV